MNNEQEKYKQNLFDIKLFVDLLENFASRLTALVEMQKMYKEFWGEGKYPFKYTQVKGLEKVLNCCKELYQIADNNISLFNEMYEKQSS